MRIQTETGNGTHAITLAGRFDAHEVPGFRAAVTLLLADGGGGANIALDLAQVIFVDSSALAELLTTQKAARKAGGDLELTALSDPVRVILELTGLGQVLTAAADSPGGRPS